METQKVLTALTQATDKLNNILIRQAYLDAIEIGLSLLLFTVLLIILGRLLYKKHKSHDYEYDDFIDFLGDNGILSIVTSIVAIIWVGMFFIGGSAIIDCIFNPQYTELKNLLNK